MGEHKHGSMDISEQEKTFEAFIKMVTSGTILTIAVMIFMALVNS